MLQIDAERIPAWGDAFKIAMWAWVPTIVNESVIYCGGSEASRTGALVLSSLVTRFFALRGVEEENKESAKKLFTASLLTSIGGSLICPPSFIAKVGGSFLGSLLPCEWGAHRLARGQRVLPQIRDHRE